MIHILLATLGVVLYRRPQARAYAIGVGALLLVVGVLWSVPGTRDMIVQLLNVNKALAVLNIVVGLLGLLIGIRSSAIVVAEGDAQRKA